MDKPVEFERLSAYLDGELNESEAREVERVIARDPRARSSLLSLRESEAALKAAMAGPAREPAPSRLVDVIDAEFTARDRRTRPGIGRLAWPIAASVVLFAFAAGYFVSAYRLDNAVELALQAKERERSVMASTLSKTLETMASGKTVSWQAAETGGRGAITPIRTYRSKSGHWCREYRVLVEAGGRRSWRGLACRTGKNRWFTVQELYTDDRRN